MLADDAAAVVQNAELPQGRHGVDHARAAQADRLAVADRVDLDAAVFDRDAFDRAFRRPHAAGNVAALERRPRRAGGRQDIAAMDQGNLGISADIHDQGGGAAAPMLLVASSAVT